VSTPLGSLAGLPPLLRDEPGLTAAFGDPQAVVALPEAARAISIAALSRISGRRPLLVACPTGNDAGQLFDDLRQYVGPDEVLLFPAWETLPFERVSPSVETMGRRLEVLWRLRTPERCPAIVVTGVRALLQKLGPGALTAEPISIKPGDILDADELLERLVMSGYRREELVEHRGEVARRGAIIDVFPSTGDSPIRIDLWGDEVDRLTEFGVNDQRSTDDLAEALIFPAREVLPNDEVRDRARSLIGEEPWGREQWERLGEGTFFDGMESWLPWLVDHDVLITDVVRDVPTVEGRPGRAATHARPARTTSSRRRTTSPAHSRAPGPAMPTRSSRDSMRHGPAARGRPTDVDDQRNAGSTGRADRERDLAGDRSSTTARG
jgi:transcription-repair coupling factor (superfamily II helicase)